MSEGCRTSYRITLRADSELFQQILENDTPDLSAVVSGEHGFLYAADPELLRSLVGNIPLEVITEESWRDEWQVGLEPLRFGEIQIVPENYKTVTTDGALILSAGRSFGIGHHPTTGLMIELMLEHRAQIKNSTVLDFGSGSGVLSLVALKLGAQSVVGLDNDPAAIAVAHENSRRNNLSAKFYLGSEPPADDHFSVVLMNVLAPVARECFPKLRSYLLPDTSVFLSGFLKGEGDEIARDLGLSMGKLHIQKEWEGAVSRFRKKKVISS